MYFRPYCLEKECWFWLGVCVCVCVCVIQPHWTIRRIRTKQNNKYPYLPAPGRPYVDGFGESEVPPFLLHPPPSTRCKSREEYMQYQEIARGSSQSGSVGKTPTSIPEDAGSIPGLAQWFMYLALTVSCGIGCRCGLDPELPWLWCRPGSCGVGLAAAALIQLLDP